MSATVAIQEVAAELEKTGFHVFRNFFDRELVEKARQEVMEWVDIDLKDRPEAVATYGWHTGKAGTSCLTNPTHILVDAYAKSPTLDQLVEEILSDPLSAGVLEKLAGKDIKFRGYNVQRMTGENDPRPDIGVSSNPHEWHRDSPGEFGIALFLEDVPGPNNGATSLVPGSHRFPYDARYNCLFGPPFYRNEKGETGSNFFVKHNIFNKLLARKVVSKTATGAYGNQGDFYFFINDVWHGREPNTEGRTGIKVMIGAFPADDSFPDKVVPPDAATLAKLPPLVRRAAGEYVSIQPGATEYTILKRFRSERDKARHPLIFTLARLEHRLAGKLSTIDFSPLVRISSAAGAGLAKIKDLFSWIRVGAT